MPDQIELRRVRNKSPEITVLRSNTARSSDDGRTSDIEQDVFAFAAETRATEQMHVRNEDLEKIQTHILNCYLEKLRLLVHPRTLHNSARILGVNCKVRNSGHVVK